MSKAKKLMQKVNNLNENLQTMKKEIIEKEQALGELRQKKVDMVLSNGKVTPKLNEDIRKLESDIHELKEHVSILEANALDTLKGDLEEVIQERKELKDKFDKEIEARENELYRMKLEFLAQILDIQNKRYELQNELDEVNSIVRFLDKRDRGLSIHQPLFLDDAYLSRGIADPSPIAPQNSEIHALTVRSSIYRKPMALELYRRTGKVVRTEKEAIEELKKLH